MAYYDRRDLIGHWVERSKPEERPCQHACCRGYRVHPANHKVIMPSSLLRQASDQDLERRYVAVAGLDTERARRQEAQIIYEMDRRDEAARDRARRAELASQRRFTRRTEQAAEQDRIFVQAEAATNGYLVTAQGRARGITDRDIVTGRLEVFQRYATPEARDYFAEHPRPTARYFQGRDTRVTHTEAAEFRKQEAARSRDRRRQAAAGRRFTRRDILKGAA